jgi:Protein of unknown function (DUF3465)
MKAALFSVLALVLSFSASAGYSVDGSAGLPDCLDDNGNVLDVNNGQVVQWKSSTPNSYHARAHVHGTITQVYPDHSGHHHFELSIGKGSDATVEIIYNEDFGSVPALSEGQDVEACGDYITSTDQAGPYPASPDGAIVHWVHMSPRPDRHPSGYIAIDGQVYGQDGSNAGPKRYPRGN